MSSDKVAEIKGLVDQDPSSAWVTALWEKYNHQRDKRINEWTELRNYVFATDTSTTSNSSLPWKNSPTYSIDRGFAKQGRHYFVTYFYRTIYNSNHSVGL